MSNVILFFSNYPYKGIKPTKGKKKTILSFALLVCINIPLRSRKRPACG
jgi:hypothetical protein